MKFKRKTSSDNIALQAAPGICLYAVQESQLFDKSDSRKKLVIFVIISIIHEIYKLYISNVIIELFF